MATEFIFMGTEFANLSREFLLTKTILFLSTEFLLINQLRDHVRIQHVNVLHQ